MRNKLNKGFTIIEILVVVAIIAIIASIVMSYVYSATVRGRDSRRKQDVDQIVKAVNMYFSANGVLPRDETGWCTYVSNTESNYGQDFQDDLLPYMKTVPSDPTKKGMVGDYLYKNTDNTGGHFVICANMEQATGDSYDYSSCPGGTTYNYCLSQ